MHNLEAQNANAKGVLGRTIDAMMSQSAPYKCDIYSIAGNEKMVEGQTAPVIVDQTKGIITYSEFDEMEENFQNMTRKSLDSVFASTYQSLLDRSLKRSNELGALLSGITLDTDDSSTYVMFERFISFLIQSLKVLTRITYTTHNPCHFIRNNNTTRTVRKLFLFSYSEY